MKACAKVHSFTEIAPFYPVLWSSAQPPSQLQRLNPWECCCTPCLQLWHHRAGEVCAHKDTKTGGSSSEGTGPFQGCWFVTAQVAMIIQSTKFHSAIWHLHAGKSRNLCHRGKKSQNVCLKHHTRRPQHFAVARPLLFWLLNLPKTLIFWLYNKIPTTIKTFH